MENKLNSNFTETYYADIFDYFINNSDQVSQVVNNITNVINNHQQKYNKSSQRKFMDIGSGPGTITKHISSLFDETQIIEPNDLFEKLYTNIKNYKLFKGNFLNYPNDG